MAIAKNVAPQFMKYIVKLRVKRKIYTLTGRFVHTVV